MSPNVIWRGATDQPYTKVYPKCTNLERGEHWLSDCAIFICVMWLLLFMVMENCYKCAKWGLQTYISLYAKSMQANHRYPLHPCIWNTEQIVSFKNMFYLCNSNQAILSYGMMEKKNYSVRKWKIAEAATWLAPLTQFVYQYINTYKCHYVKGDILTWWPLIAMFV